MAATLSPVGGTKKSVTIEAGKSGQESADKEKDTYEAKR